MVQKGGGVPEELEGRLVHFHGGSVSPNRPCNLLKANFFSISTNRRLDLMPSGQAFCSGGKSSFVGS